VRLGTLHVSLIAPPVKVVASSSGTTPAAACWWARATARSMLA